MKPNIKETCKFANTNTKPSIVSPSASNIHTNKMPLDNMMITYLLTILERSPLFSVLYSALPNYGEGGGFESVTQRLNSLIMH